MHRGLGLRSRNLGLIFLPTIVVGASFDPFDKYSIMEPSGITFRGLLKLSVVGLVVKKRGGKSIDLFALKISNLCKF